MATATSPAPANLELQELQAVQKKNSEGIEALTKSVGSLVETLKKTRADGHPDPQSVLGGLPGSAPWARKGENPMASRGFSFMKMLGLAGGQLDPDECKVEADVCNRLHNIYIKNVSPSTGYQAKGTGPRGSFLAPLGSDYLHSEFVPYDFRVEMKSLVNAGVQGANPDEVAYLQKQMAERGNFRYGTKALSWLNEFTGGSLVAPPEMGELIELLRNKEALINAGAKTVPLPPQGRIKYPRQTLASTAYWVGENAPSTESSIGTGEVTLQAKKLVVRIHMPNELIRFASPAAEALVRDDMTKTLALALDMAGLEGAGGDHRPRGLILDPNINTVTSSSVTANGDRLVGGDIYRMIAAVEESNAEFQGWVMRPKTLYKYYQLRADAVAAGDKAGLFLFDAIREPGLAPKPQLGGHPVTLSTQVSQVRSKGSSSTLTYIVGGMWSDLLIGMFGAIEFAQTTQGDTAFINDQTWVRGILTADIAARHSAGFVFMDNLDVVNL